MRQKILDNVFLHITINLTWNLGLWFLFIYGGSISTAKAQHFWSSSYHIVIASVIITLISRWTKVEPKSYLHIENKKLFLQKTADAVQKFFWSIIDLFNFLFWLLFDSWRKPDVELFTRMSTSECTKAMVDACNEEIASENESPITGYFGSSYFSMLKWSPTPFGKVAVINSTILYGKIYNVQKGVFIRAWHRLPTAFLLFIALWVSGFTSFLLTILELWIGSLPKFAFMALEVFGTIDWLLLIMWIGTMFARETKNDLNVFLKNIFSPTTVAQHSVHPTGGSRRVF